MFCRREWQRRLSLDEVVLGFNHIYLTYETIFRFVLQFKIQSDRSSLLLKDYDLWFGWSFKQYDSPEREKIIQCQMYNILYNIKWVVTAVNIIKFMQLLSDK
jgi:hypothetical protein